MNFLIFQVLEDSGVRHLNTLCHGDAKPNNFMFRKIDIDFGEDDDEELKDLKCEGVESMLIDWQGGFLGNIFLAYSNISYAYTLKYMKLLLIRFVSH